MWPSQAVAADLGGGRTPQQAMHRATKRGVGTQIRKGTWDPAEDEALLQVRQALRLLLSAERHPA